MPLILLCLVIFLIGGGLRTSSRTSLHPTGIIMLIACIPAFLATFLLIHGAQSLLVPLTALPFLILPYFLIGVALILPAIAEKPKWLRVFAVSYGAFLLLWCVTLVISNPPWASQIVGK